MRVISRATARKRGLKRYFTGKPCLRGHIEQRLVSSKGCCGCQREYQRSESGLAVRKKYNASEKGLAVKRKYEASGKGLARGRKYKASQKGQFAERKYRERKKLENEQSV